MEPLQNRTPSLLHLPFSRVTPIFLRSSISVLNPARSSWNFQGNSQWVSQDDPTQWSGSTDSQLQSGTTNLLQVWPCSWCTPNHARELKIGVCLKNVILCSFMMSNVIPKWPKPPKLLSRTIKVIQLWLFSWYTFIHSRELKSGIQPRNDIFC